MENMNVALLSSCSTSSPNLVFGTSHFLSRPRFDPFVFPNSIAAPRSSRSRIYAISRSNNSPRITHRVVGKNFGSFARISSATEEQTTSVGVNPNLYVPPPSSSQTGSPLFWVGVGVALCAVFSSGASWLKKYAMQQAFKAAMNQMGTQNDPFNTGASPNPFNTGASPSPFPFPFPTPPTPQSTVSPSPTTSRPAVTVDVQATQVKAAPAAAKVESEAAPTTSFKYEPDTKKETNKYAFVDISPEDTVQESPFESSVVVDGESSSLNVESPTEVSQNGAASKQDFDALLGGAFGGSQSTQKAGSGLSVEALEKMMDDPTVQKMVYPYLPEEMRNPETFKWMMQNPQYRQQLEDMLNGMGGSGEWDNRMMESLKNFDLNSPEVKQQFDQIGMSPEEVINKIMANPEVAMAFQNPRVQQAIMDCSTNPLSIAKYQNDKEVMDVFNKISELFPGTTGPF